MAVDTSFNSLFESLKLEDPWLPPRPWESIPSESGLSHSTSSSHSSTQLYDTPIVSEASLVRLAINALQGLKSALASIEKLCEEFDSYPADRTSHRIPSLWHRSTSTIALGNLIKSIGRSGSVVFLLLQFVEHYSCLNLDEPGAENPPYSLVNQAFAVGVRRVLEGYICAVDTLYASVGARRSQKSGDSCFKVGCLGRPVHSEVTLLEVYLHTRELTTQIEALGSICNVQEIGLCFSESPFEGLVARAKLKFGEFPRGGDLLTYLYGQLKVAEPVHNSLLKFLFLKSFEPYSEFIRSWIFKAKFCDPYKEFLVEHGETSPSWSSGEAERCSDISLATIREHVPVPCFLKDISVPLLRTGQQLQVLIKLLELCTHVDTGNHKYEDVLSSWRGFSVGYSCHATPLTFNNDAIEAMVLSRNNYYKEMLEKLDITLTKLDIRFQQVISHANLPVFANDNGGDENLFSYSTDKLDFNAAAGTVDSETSSSSDEFSFVDDHEESSVCSSSSCFEDQDESLNLNQCSSSFVAFEQRCLSALDFFPNAPDSSSPNRSERDPSNSFNGDSCQIPDRTDPYNPSGHPGPGERDLRSNPPWFESQEPKRPSFSEIQCSSIQPDAGLYLSGPVKNPFLIEEGSNYRFNPPERGSVVNSKNTVIFNEEASHLSNLEVAKNSSNGEVIDRGQLPSRVNDSASLLLNPNLNLKYCSNLLSMNPMLSKTDLMSKHVDRGPTDQTRPFPSFDFSSVGNPFKVLVDQSQYIPRHQSGADVTIPKDYRTSAATGMANCRDNKGNDAYGISISKIDVPGVSTPESNYEKKENLIPASGGSGWQSMLGCLDYTVNPRAKVQKKSLEATFKIPLDFVIEKCLLQEILLQYRYVSKLTIKLLDQAFDLQEHLLALRRYHFMGFADWADLFITSLWRHKWLATEAAHKVSEIQGLLEMSVQRSSCARDKYKDKLFVYIKEKGSGAMPLSSSTIRIDSFDFVGLGYKVDWPVSLVLTPSALKIYSQIFTFLIRVKLGVFSLTEVWCSLKDLLHLVSKKTHSKVCTPEMRHFNILMRVRHEVNHFISTLQQYVQSQLSHVSWCRFSDSLNHKVKDMVDLEILHVAYLTDCLHMCFLSDEMQSVASIIESILQCAIDFRSCLGTADVGLNGGFSVKLSRIDISKVLAIKRTFDNNIKELHLLYLKTPGLSDFWGYLNYNDYYSDGSSNRIRY